MGLVGALLVWASGNFYQHLVLDNQRAILSEQMHARLNDWRRELEAQSQQLALLIRSEPNFVAAVAAKKSAVVTRQLDMLFDRPGVLSARVKLAKLQVFDEKLVGLAASTKGIPSAALDQASCINARTVALSRVDAKRDKPALGICVSDKNIYQLFFMPLGERTTSGYLLIALDMTSKLTGRDNLFAMPTRITLADGSLLHLSPAWPRDSETENYLEAEQTLGALAISRSTLNIAVSQDIRVLKQNLIGTERLMLAAAMIVLLSILLLIWIGVQKTTVNPLRQLLIQLRRLYAEKINLDKPIVIEGNAEVAELSMGINEMMGRLKELYNSFESLAFTDPLTQLPNRTVFHDRLEKGIEIAKQDYKPFALFLMDIDRFKDINDTLGHPIGDLLLQQVAARLRGKLRDIDTLARMGGDEFAILLPAVNDKHAAMAARMLLQALRAPFQVADQSLDISASIGIALYPDHGVDANILTQRADVAMYAAKNANSGHAFYDSKLDQHNPTRLTLLGELRHAVEQEQFVLYFQPKVNLKNYQVSGVEALVRWNHPRENLMLPDTFIPLLEQTGLIRSLTPWVLNQALREGQSLQDQKMPITISMNLSARDLQDPYLAEAFAEQLAALQISPRWLELEITESAVMTDPERAFEVLTRLSKMGLKLAIDDFGTGYSSLSYLKKLPVNTIKIDKSFVIGMERDENDAAIVRTSIDLGHNLGLEVVAEGVENEETLKRLAELGCDTAQGHYMSRPLSAEELNVWLKQSSWAIKRNPKLVRLHN